MFYLGIVRPRSLRAASLIYKTTYAGSHHPKTIKKNTVSKSYSLPVAYLGVLSGHDASEECASGVLNA